MPARLTKPRTIHDIARVAGVSARTVSRVLNDTGYVATPTRARIRQAIKADGYRPSGVARLLRTGQSHEICIVSSWPDELNIAQIAGFEHALRAAGYWVSLLFVAPDDPSVAEVFANIRTRRPAAITTFRNEFATDGIDTAGLLENNFPHIVMDVRDDRHDGVVIDRPSGIREALNYLADQGHRRIAYLGLRHDTSRINAYQAFMSARDLTPIWLPYDDIRADRFEAGRLSAAAVARLDPRPDAVQAFSDAVALGLIAGLHALGIAVPRDIAVVGFDDIQAAAWCLPALTTVAQPSRAIGAAAAELLLHRLQNKDSSSGPLRRVLPTTLIKRASA